MTTTTIAEQDASYYHTYPRFSPLTDGLLARVVVVGGGGEGGDPGPEPLGPGLDGDHLLAQRREQLVRLPQQTRQLPDGLHSAHRVNGAIFQYL